MLQGVSPYTLQGVSPNTPQGVTPDAPQRVSPDALQGVTQTSLTALPGAQFLTSGLVYVPDAYFKVVAMRMMLDVVVYLGMLAVFSAAVLLHDDGPLTAGEILFVFYVLASQ